MNRDEYERLKEAEKAHLLKVRALKQQLREARRKQNVAEALRGLDTSELGREFDEALRAVQQESLTSEARFEIAMDALDEAERREEQRLELERFEQEQRAKAAADLVTRLKSELAEGQGAPERSTSQSSHGASALDEAASDEPASEQPRARPQQDDERPGKTIGRRHSRSD